MPKDATNENTDILNIPDDEFANLSVPPIPEDSEEEPREDEEYTKEEEENATADKEDSTATEDEEDDIPESSEEPHKESESQVDFDLEEDATSSPSPSKSDTFLDEKTSKEKSTESEKDSKTEEQPSIDYKSVYEKIFQPFKANGREMQVRSPDEVVQLMQMGANYNKKMAAIKKQLPYLKMLEKNNLLDENELSFLIDLKERKPEAIAKLLQDSKIDLYDFDAEQLSTGYAPTNRAVSQQEIEVEEVLSQIQDSPQYKRTVTTLGNEWDEASRTRIANQPQLIKVINEHMESGLYDTIQKEIDRLRTLGQLTGVSDFDAYDKVGAMIFEQNNPPQQQVNQNKNTNYIPQNNIQQSQQELAKRKQEEIQRRKRAASSNVKKAPQQSTDVIDILNLPDEEFEKIGANKNWI